LLFLSKFIEKDFFFKTWFSFTINDVQAKSEYLWRYQRYELIREYFEKPPLAYPPLSLIGYLLLLLQYIFCRKNLFRIFSKLFFLSKKRISLIWFCLERFSKDKNKDWTDFESAATYNYTRTFVDRMYRDSSTLVIPTYSIRIFISRNFYFLFSLDFLRSMN